MNDQMPTGSDWPAPGEPFQSRASMEARYGRPFTDVEWDALAPQVERIDAVAQIGQDGTRERIQDWFDRALAGAGLNESRCTECEELAVEMTDSTTCHVRPARDFHIEESPAVGEPMTGVAGYVVARDLDADHEAVLMPASGPASDEQFHPMLDPYGDTEGMRACR